MSTSQRYSWIAEIGSDRPASSTIPSASKIFRHASAKDGFPTLDGISSLYELFTQSVDKFPNNKCLGHRPKLADGTVGPFSWKTYKEVADEVALIASGIKAVGVVANGSIGVFGGNCPEWMIAMQVGLLSLLCVNASDRPSLHRLATASILPVSPSMTLWERTPSSSSSITRRPRLCLLLLRSFLIWPRPSPRPRTFSRLLSTGVRGTRLRLR